MSGVPAEDRARDRDARPTGLGVVKKDLSPEVEIVSGVQQVDFPEEWYHHTAASHFWFQWRLRAALRQIRDVGIPTELPLRGLEIGSGTGVLRQQLEACTEWTVDMTDLHLEALRAGSRGRGRTLYYNILEERPEFVGAYDVIVLFDVLEHVEGTRVFLRSLLRHLRPGGWLLLNVPAHPLLYGAYDRAAGHVRRYSRDALAAEFAETDLEIHDLRSWGMPLVPLLFVRKLVQRDTASASAIIRAGFRPPGRVAHGLLRALMRLETALGRPPIGTSLLLAGRRRSSR